MARKTLWLGLLLLAALPVCSIAALGAPAPVEAGKLSADAPPALKVLDNYVTVVGGVIAALGTVLGLPLVFQTFQKTRAEIRKINLESEKLEAEKSGAIRPDGSGPGGLSVRLEGGKGHIVQISADPRFSIPLLLLTDALIAYIYYRMASFVLSILSLPNFIEGPIYLLIFLAIFWPILRTAQQVKSTFGEAWIADKTNRSSQPSAES